MMVQAKPPKVWEQEFARLSYEWEKVYAYGDTDSMCTDGVILNRIRQELSELKEKLDVAGTDGEWLIPPEVEKSFMACAGSPPEADTEAEEGNPSAGSIRKSYGACRCAYRR